MTDLLGFYEPGLEGVFFFLVFPPLCYLALVLVSSFFFFCLVCLESDLVLLGKKQQPGFLCIKSVVCLSKGNKEVRTATLLIVLFWLVPGTTLCVAFY